MSRMSELHYEEQRLEYEEHGTMDGRFVVIHLDNRFVGAGSVSKVAGPFRLAAANSEAIRLQSEATKDGREHRQFVVWPVSR